MSDFNLTGLSSILSEMEKRLGSERVKVVTNKALRTIAREHVEPDLKKTVAKFAKTGKIVRQTSVGNVSWADYHIPRIKIGWARSPIGETPRWNLEHLNEFGFSRQGKFYRPDGFGKMQELVDEYETLYPAMVQEELKELVE